MKKMNLIKVASLLLLGASITGCNKVPAGNVGIKYYLLGANKGIDYETLSPGRYWIGVNEDLYLFPTYRMNRVWTDSETEGSPIKEGFEFQSIEGMKLGADVGVEYHINSENIPRIFEMYKKGYEEITDIVLRNAVRDAFQLVASKYATESMYGEGKEKFMNDIREVAKSKMKEKFIELDDIYLLGNLRIPNEVTNALNDKISAKQRAEKRENELKEAEALAKIKITNANAEAESNRILSNSLNPDLIEYMKLQKWDGKLPKVTGGNSLVDIR